MDFNKQQLSEQVYCALCFGRKCSTKPDEVFVAIHSEEGRSRNISALIRKYFPEENIQEKGFCCPSCCQQLENFHRFYLQIKEIQSSGRMRSIEANEGANQLSEAFQLDMHIKEEKIDEGYNYNQTGDEEALNDFLKGQYRPQSDTNGNDLSQNRILDAIVNEFQASSLSGTESIGCGTDQPYSKRVKRKLNENWQTSRNDLVFSNTNDPDLDFMDEEFYQYDKPPDDREDHTTSAEASPFEELERLRRENELLKRRNHQLVVRLKEVHVRNMDLVKVNQELSDKLQLYDQGPYTRAGPTIPEHISSSSKSATSTTNNKQPSTKSSLVIGPIQDIPPPLHQEQQLQHTSSDRIKSSAYILDNGDVIVRDSLIPFQTMVDIDSVEPGEKYDLRFISKLALALWGQERLAVSSVTGRKSNNAVNATPSIQLEPEKLSFIKEKVYNRVMQESNDRLQAMARSDDARINRLLNIKIQNAKRKKTPNQPNV